MKQFAVVSLLAGLAACTPHDQRETQRDLHKTGEAVKKELKTDAQFVKQEALKARAETQKDVKKLKRDINADRAAHRDDSPPPDNSQR